MEYSAGIIPFRIDENGVMEFFVGHPGGQSEKWANYWAFLKGGVEEGETWIETALREFKEESGLELEDVDEGELIPLGTSQQNKHKVVIAFGLYYPNIDVNTCHSNISDDGVTLEVDRYAWKTFEELEKVTHKMHLQFYRQLLSMNDD